jgi:hypothetical protein
MLNNFFPKIIDSASVVLLWYKVRGALGLPLHPLRVFMIVSSCTETIFQLILFSLRGNLDVFLRLRTPVYYNPHFLFRMSRGLKSLFLQELGSLCVSEGEKFCAAEFNAYFKNSEI